MQSLEEEITTRDPVLVSLTSSRVITRPFFFRSVVYKGSKKDHRSLLWNTRRTSIIGKREVERKGTTVLRLYLRNPGILSREL